MDKHHIPQENDALRAKLQMYEIILAQTENVLFEWDPTEDVLVFSETWEALFSSVPVCRAVRDVLTDGSCVHPDDLPLLTDRIDKLKKGSSYEMAEIRIAANQNRFLWCRVRASAIRDADGLLRKVVGIIINIDAEKQAERKLRERAERDPLTGLLDKQTARKQIEEYLAQAPGMVPCSMLIIDLDDFKQVNDQHGHLLGDELLTKAARKIEKRFRSQDIVARIGGDEFLVFLRGLSDRTLLENRCDQLLQDLRTVCSDRRIQPFLSGSIGIAVSPEHGAVYEALFRHADEALYLAKAQGKNRAAFFDSGNPPAGMESIDSQPEVPACIPRKTVV